MHPYTHRARLHSMTNFINVPVPEEHVLAVYDLLSRLEKGEADVASRAGAPADPTKDIVKRMYDESQPRQCQLLDYLADRPDQWIYASEIIQALDLAGSSSLAGITGPFSRRANHRYEGAMPWRHEWDRGRGQGRYLMPGQVAGWVREAADA